MMRIDDRWFTRIAGLCGVVGPLTALVLAFVALFSSSWFNLQANTLGDLGLHGTSLFFNTGLAVAGLLNLPFALGLRRSLGSSTLSNIGTVLLTLGGISLILVAVLTEATQVVREAVAVLYFLLFPGGLILLGLIMFRCSATNKGEFTIIAGITALLLLFSTQWLLHSWAIPEILEALVMVAWSVTLGARLFLQEE